MDRARDYYAADVRRMNAAQAAHLERERQHRRDRRSPGLSPLAALAIAGGAVAVSALVGRRYSPDKSHPSIDRWYHEDLEKPSFTPPDAVFGAVWPVLEVMLATGGYRLLRQPSSPERTAALALWGFNVAMIAVWTKTFFGERSLGGGLAEAGTMVGAGAAYVAGASRVDGVAAAMGVPYTAWVGYATTLAEDIWRRNA